MVDDTLALRLSTFSRRGSSAIREAASSLRSGLLSDLLLYACVAFSAPLLGVIGALASPLVWVGSAHRRNVGLLIAASACLLGSQHFAFVEHWLSIGMQGLGLVPAALGLLIRPSGVAIAVLAGWRNRWLRQVLALNVACVGISLAFVQILAWNRADVADVGFAMVSIAAATETLNAWALWRHRGEEAPLRVYHLAAAVAVLAITMQAPVRTPARTDVTLWWPADGRQEFASVRDGYGWRHIGHLGELPLWLRKSGYNVTLRPNLEDVTGSVIVVPAPIRPLRSAETDSLRRAAMAGSRLLLIAEHTNLDGVRDSFNRVLANTGMELNFDTTNGVFGDSTMSLSGPLVRSSPLLTHNRGASLTVRDPRPVVLLKGGWWHSDIGDPLAPEKGYLSDYRLSPGDRLGNLTLAAKSRLGRGEIFIWGDGSPFLNQNLAYNSTFLLALMLEVGGNDRLRWFGPIGGALIMLLWAVSRRPAIVGLAIALALALPFRPLPKPSLPNDLAIISDQENNGFDRDAFSPTSVTGLGVALTRAGLVPSVMSWASLRRPPRALFVINPLRTINDIYARRLRDLASAGTTVVISGAGDNRTFQKLAGFFGAIPTGPPLGSLASTDFTTYSAWRLKIQQGTPLRAGDNNVGAIIHIGKGRVVILADGGFFFSRNLETETQFDIKNLTFVHRLIEP